jgi:hypothetical protein
MTLAEAQLRKALREWFESGGTYDQFMEIVKQVWENTTYPSEEK